MMFLKKYSTIIAAVFGGILYYYFAYHLERTNFSVLVSLWVLLFATSYFIYQQQNSSFKELAVIAIFFRLIFLVAIPNLSQDFYRFIWDGRMILQGFNPYISLPQTFIEQGNYPISEAVELYNGMGKMNGSHFTNYPPINQLCFLIAAIFGGKSILSAAIVMRTLLILADVGILYFGKRLLEHLNLNPKTIFLYLLNPFIIIELTGNLHFEPVMLFFLVWSLFALSKKKWILSALLLACSVSVKLIPFLFLPLYFQFFTQNKFNSSSVKKLLGFYSVTLLTIAVLFAPFLSAKFFSSYSNSVGLWFRNFEFNASFYYVFREIGYLFRGWNEIAIIGKIIPILVIFFVACITFFRNNKSLQPLITAMLFALSFYYFTSTTVHPWYLATLVLLSVFTKYRFPVIWSLVIIVSYQAYANNPWKENLGFVFCEYLVVYSIFVFEIMYKKNNVTTVM